MESEAGLISRRILDSHGLGMSWRNSIQNIFAVIEFILILALILISLIAMVPGLCVRESARKHLCL